MSAFYGATRFLVVEVCDPDEEGNGKFLRLKVSAEIDEDHPGMRVQVLHQMFPWKRAFRLARIIHLCGIIMERVTNFDLRWDNRESTRVPITLVSEIEKSLS